MGTVGEGRPGELQKSEDVVERALTVCACCGVERAGVSRKRRATNLCASAVPFRARSNWSASQDH